MINKNLLMGVILEEAAKRGDSVSIEQANIQYKKLQDSRNPQPARPHRHGATVMRLQPMTLAHEAFLEEALSVIEELVLVIGSAFEAPHIKNPFTFEMRRAMVEARFPDQVASGRLKIVGLEDYNYRAKTWYKKFYELVYKTFNDSRKPYELPFTQPNEFVLFTYGKDADTTAYIEDFDKRTKRVYHNPADPTINATDARMALFRGVAPVNIANLSADVKLRLYSYKLTEEYETFARELKAVEDYRSLWNPYTTDEGKTIRNPFPVQFMAVDALVVWKDRWGKPHFLVIRRKSEFGNGKLAIPGGYLDSNETVLDGAKRELKEETGLRVDEAFILRQVRVFDDPNRSMRGRMVTFCHVWELCSETKPTVEGMDDASEAFWLPIDEVYSRKRDFFSDHYYILSFFYPELEDTF